MFDPTSVRPQFPALQQTDEEGQPYFFFDGPGGTQVPQAVIDAMTHFYTHANANLGGPFTHSQRAEAIAQEARQAMADFLNAPSPNDIVFGPSATNLAFNLSRSIAATLNPNQDDEIIVTRLDHEANVAPWLSLQEQGLTVHRIDFGVEDCTLDLDHFYSLLSRKTKLVAVGWASNAVGTVRAIAWVM